MAEYYNVVPWSNSKEWLDVCEKLHPSNSMECKTVALEKLMVWKARCPFLPSGIESTLTLLEVTVKNAAMYNTCDIATEELLRLAYSTAIMRFVNHMFDGETAKGSSLYQAAVYLNVPSWVVDLRHNTAHSNSLPTLQLLKDATEFGLSWLYEHYWLKHKSFICDYVTSNQVVIEENEHKLGALMNFCVSLSICANNKTKIKNLADIPDIYMQESILNDLQELFGNTIDLSNLKTTSIASLINLMTAQSKKLLQANHTAFHINRALLGEDSLILSLELSKYFNNSMFQNKKSLSWQYIQCFEVLLTFLHSNDLLEDFVLELIKLSEKDCIGHEKRLLSALWVAEILRGLKNCRDFTDKMKSVEPDIFPKKRKDLLNLYHHWFPNNSKNVLVLDFQKCVPHNLTNFYFMQPFISSYNPYLTFFIRNLLNVIQPKLDQIIIDNICQLADLIAFPDKFPAKSSKIYTKDDLKVLAYLKTEETEMNDIPVVKPSTCNSMYKELHIDSEKNGIWKMSTIDAHWSSCPVGLLPWQLDSEKDTDSIMDNDVLNHKK